MLALAVDLIWGYAGILSLGHAAFFSLGGYAMGMYLMRQIGPRGVYGNPILPDFMVFLNWTELPWFWYGFNHFWFALAVIVVLPGALAFVFGWLTFRSRVTGVYLSIITQALSYALMLAFFRNDMGFGGNNGFTDFKELLGFDLQRDSTRAALVALTAIALAASYLCVPLRRAQPRRPGGAGDPRRREPGPLSRLPVETLQAVAVRVLGADCRHRRGAVRAAGRHHQPERVRADQLDRGGDLGRRSAGAARCTARRSGAVAVNYAKTFFTGAFPEVWLYALGALFVAGDAVPAARPHRAPAARQRGGMTTTLSAPCRRGRRGRASGRTRICRARPGAAARTQDSLPRTPHRQLRRLQGAQRPDAVRRARASCAASSARTAPARRR